MQSFLPGSVGRFLRRRRGVIGGTLAVVLGASLVATWLWPATYIARATVAPAESEYTGPAHRLIARVTSRTVLARVAETAGLVPADDLGLVARLTLPADPASRVQPDDQALIAPAPGHGAPVRELVITTRATEAAAARNAADEIARRLVDLDAQLRGAKPAASKADAPLLPQYEVELAALRQRFPLLGDRSRVEAYRRAEATITAERSEVLALTARLKGYETKAKRLWALVEAEARDAWAQHLEAEAARLAKREAEQHPPAAKPTTPAGVAKRPSTVEALEDELQRLLSKLTPRHPDVRRVVRLLEAERRRAAEHAPPPAPAEPQPKAKPPAKPDESAEEPAHDRALSDPIADDPAAPLAPADPQPKPPNPATDEVPARFLHGATSYPGWLAARNQVDDTRAQLEARREGLQAQIAAHEREGAALDELLKGLPEAQREEARLKSLIETTRQREPGQRAAGPHAPLLPGETARIVAAYRPRRFLPAAFAVALLLAAVLALLAERQDTSVRADDDLTSLGVPTLGVIPHLPRGRR